MQPSLFPELDLPLSPATDLSGTAVHLLAGPAGSGKTTLLRERCRAWAAEGTLLWLAPSRRHAEKLSFHRMPAENILVRTFDSFAAEVIAKHDPRARPLPRGQARLILEDLLHDLDRRQRIQPFHRVLETRGFLENAHALIEELQSHDIAPAVFQKAARTEKLQACALLYTEYRKRLKARNLVDVQSWTANAAELLKEKGWQDLRAVVIDDMPELTGPQLALLGALQARGAELAIALLDDEDEERAELFTTTRRLRLQFPQADAAILARRDAQPAGLRHLEQHLFRPIRRIPRADDVSGLQLLEAPGLMGEARMVARRIKELLLDGANADQILVSARELKPYATLLHEVFDEYGIPCEIEGTEPLLHDPQVRLLLQALRLPDDDFPFAGTTALLRSGWPRPTWPEATPGMALRSETLLRLLAVPGGKDVVLAAVRRAADISPQVHDSDELEVSRAVHRHELARDCAPFLTRFFAAWDRFPTTGSVAEHVAALDRFVTELGLEQKPSPAWLALLREIDAWVQRESIPSRKLDRKTFLRRLQALASVAGLARTPRGPGRVQVLSAPLARSLDAEYVFVLGLGERGFPRLATPSPLLDESERNHLRGAGLPLCRAADLLPEEMLLFYQLATRARKQLVLSYPAVDEKGQLLLPGSFLHAVLDLFAEDAIATESKKMLIEGYDREPPLSAAEARLRLAPRVQGSDESREADLLGNLYDAALMQQQRFHRGEYGPYEGKFQDPRVIADVARRFGPQRSFSPTALDEYITCPFKFLQRHVLRLEPLEEPQEQIEAHHRGSTIHRALSRLHGQLKQDGIHQPDENLSELVHGFFQAAVAEDMDEASGPASRKLWELEGVRLQRVAARYPRQWDELLQPWRKVKCEPRPHALEQPFGGQAERAFLLPTTGIEIRLHGTIDRVDVAELDGEVGFWILDYKTGSAAYYNSNEVQSFRRLQLLLYALAVEETVLAVQKARPLGLAYWLLRDKGPRVTLPEKKDVTSWLKDRDAWRHVRQILLEWVSTLVGHLRAGHFPLAPRDEYCTQTCDYSLMCRISQVRHLAKEGMLELPLVEQASEGDSE